MTTWRGAAKGARGVAGRAVAAVALAKLDERGQARLEDCFDGNMQA